MNDYSKDTPVSGDELSALIKTAQQNGDLYLGYLKDELHNNIDDYPTYEASDSYDSTNIGDIRVNTDKKTFWT